MGHCRCQLTTSASGRTVVPSQYGAFMKALDFIWEIPTEIISVLHEIASISTAANQR